MPIIRRTVTTLQETLMAQVPEKQAAMAKLKKEHGSHVYVCYLIVRNVFDFLRLFSHLDANSFLFSVLRLQHLYIYIYIYI